VLLPILNLRIPVVADDYADPHSVRRREDHAGARRERLRGGRRHSLPTPVVIDEHGVMGEVENARAECRIPFAASIASTRDSSRRSARGQRRLVKKEPHTYGVRTAIAAYGGRAASERPMVRAHANAAHPRSRLCARAAFASCPRNGSGVRALDDEHPRLEHLAQLWWGHRCRVVLQGMRSPQTSSRVARISPVSALRLAVVQDEDVLDTGSRAVVADVPRSARAATTPICAHSIPPTCS